MKSTGTSQKLFWPFTVRINNSSNLKLLANYRPSASNFKRNNELFFNRLLGVQWLVDLTLHFAVEPNNEQAIPNLLTELNIFSDPDSRSFVEQKSPQFFFSVREVVFCSQNWSDFLREKKCSSKRGWRPRISRVLRSLEQFTYSNSERSEQLL